MCMQERERRKKNGPEGVGPREVGRVERRNKNVAAQSEGLDS